MLDDSDHPSIEDEPPLFPKIVPTAKHKLQSKDLVDIVSDDNQSVQNLRNILFRPADYLESVDLSNISASNYNNTTTNTDHFQTQFDTDSDDESVNRFSIHSSIINQIDISDIGRNHEDSKFQYLRAYEQKRKLVPRLHTERHGDDHGDDLEHDQDGIPLKVLDNTSVFNLSKLDDFNKFVRLTEINDAIHKKYLGKHQLDKYGQTLELDVLPPAGLGDNYVGNFDDDHSNKKKKNKLRKSSWYSLDWQKKPTPLSKKRQSEIQEISFNSGTPSTSDTISPREALGDHISVESSSMYRDGDGRGNVRGTTPDSTDSDDAKVQTNYLQRKLKVRHLQMISFGGTLGVGLFLNSGKALTIAGGFGTLLAFVICGIIVLTTMISFCEMVTFVSVIDGVSGLSSRFVDDSFGFAVGWLYFFSFGFGLTGEIVASVIMLSYYPELKVLDNKASCAGFVTLFLIIILVCNLIDVRIFGEVEYISSFIKLFTCLLMIIVMIALNTGSIGGKKLDLNIGNIVIQILIIN